MYCPVSITIILKGCSLYVVIAPGCPGGCMKKEEYFSKEELKQIENRNIQEMFHKSVHLPGKYD